MIPFIYDSQYRIISDYINYIKPYYIIYTNSMVYSIKSKKYLSPIMLESGYYYYNLSTYNGMILKRINRLMMEIFMYFDGCERYQVNHIDGDKSHNYIWNLEWVTPKENVQHAIDNNLRKPFFGENNPQAKITEKEAKIIIKMILDGYDDNYIHKETSVPISIIREIANGNTWVYLTNGYTDKLKLSRRRNIITDEKRHLICEFFQKYKNNYSNKYGSVKNMAIDALRYSNVPIQNNTINIAKRLYYRYDRDDITSNYNY